jgi:tRNA (cytosine38-C5)-methyltransferase
MSDDLPAHLPSCLPCPPALPSCSFLNLLDRIPAMTQPPSHLLLENVVGFETSDMHMLLLQCLEGAGYYVAEFILTPLQYGIPYSRPR